MCEFARGPGTLAPVLTGTCFCFPPFASAEGHPEAAAQRLGCWVHDVDFLTCSWEAGRAAPGDVQYRLYWQDLK